MAFQKMDRTYGPAPLVVAAALLCVASGTIAHAQAVETSAGGGQQGRPAQVEPGGSGSAGALGVVAPGQPNNGTSIGASEAVSAPLPPTVNVAPLPAPEALFPEMFGLGPMLRDHGIAVLLDTRNEFDGVISGPRQGASNAGQYGFETDIDWERLADITGFSTHFLMVGRYGIPISRAFGDQLNPSQEIYGAGGNVVSHFVYGYGEETLAHGAVDIAAGRMPLLDDFAASPLYCVYENNAFCGNPKATSDNIGFSSYPDSTWAIRARVRPVPYIYVQTGIYFDQANLYNYAKNDRSNWTWDASYINGETFPVEVGWEPSFGPDKLVGHYKAGFWYDNENHADDLFDVNDVPYMISGQAPRQVKGETAFYFFVDQMLMRNGTGDTNGLIVLAGYYQNSETVSLRQKQFEIGLIDNGFWKARPLDGFAIGFSWMQVSPYVTRAEEIEQDLGLLPEPPPGKIPSSIAATGVQTHTMNLEANYTIHIFRGVTLTPDFQYYFRPNGQRNLPNAALLGFISHIQIF
jgi:porin